MKGSVIFFLMLRKKERAGKCTLLKVLIKMELIVLLIADLLDRRKKPSAEATDIFLPGYACVILPL